MLLKYYIETCLLDKWQVLTGDTDDSLKYMEGLFEGYSSSAGPRPARRLVRTSDRKVLKAVGAFNEVSTLRLGMAGASWPYYVGGAVTALQRAMSDMGTKDAERKAKLQVLVNQLQELLNGP